MPQDDLNSTSVPNEDGYNKFIALFMKHEKRFINFVKRHTTPPISVEDVIQESAIKALKKFGTLRDKRKFGSWFKTILLRTLIRMQEKSKADTRRDKEYVDMNPRQQSDPAIDFREETGNPVNDQVPAIHSVPTPRTDSMPDNSPNPPPSPKDIHKEIIREGLETFHEVKDDSDFLPWIHRISTKIRAKMHGKHINPEKDPPDDENDEEE